MLSVISIVQNLRNKELHSPLISWLKSHTYRTLLSEVDGL